MTKRVYCGYIKDEKKLRSTASGGLATSMAEHALDMGGVVYGVSYASDFKSAKYIRVVDKEGIEKLKGSKYIKAQLDSDVIKTLIEDVKCGKQVLFIGLPCDAKVVNSLVKKETENFEKFSCVDLICHGPTFLSAWKDYIELLEKKEKSEVKNINIRYKNPFWTPPHMFVEFKNGNKMVENLYATEFGQAFRMMPEKQCFKCTHKGENYSSDITIGDYWGCKDGDVGYNKYGTSLAFVHTEKGDAFIKALDGFILEEADSEKALKYNPRYLSPVQNTADKERFRANYEKKGLKYAVSCNLTLIQKIKRFVKKIFRK